jgi:hypothetical protein
MREERRKLEKELDWRRQILNIEAHPLALDAPRGRTGERDPSGRARGLLGGAGSSVAEVPSIGSIRGSWVADGRKVSVAGDYDARFTQQPRRRGGIALRSATEK